MDVIYNPLRTKLLLQAQEMGIPCCNGLEMLVARGQIRRRALSGQEIPDSEISASTASCAYRWKTSP